jgi:hypothetical protein
MAIVLGRTTRPRTEPVGAAAHVTRAANVETYFVRGHARGLSNWMAPRYQTLADRSLETADRST